MESKWPAYTDDPEIIKRGLEEYRNLFGTEPKGDTDQEKYIVSRQVIEVAEWNGPDDLTREERKAWADNMSVWLLPGARGREVKRR